MIIIDTDMKTARASQKGFTLIELLVVIGILAVLLAITLIAINPARQFSQANNTQRASDVNAILNAVWQYGVEHNGDLGDLNGGAGLPIAGTDAAAPIGDNDPPVDAGVPEVDLCPDIAPVFIAQMPVDPQDGSWVDCDDYFTGYTIIQTDPTTEAGRVTIAAPSAENGVTIEVTR